MKPRFYPSQEVWMPYGKIALCVDVMSITWDIDEVEYTIQTMSEIGHQEFTEMIDTKEEKCLLFENEKQCIDFIKSKTNKL